MNNLDNIKIPVNYNLAIEEALTKGFNKRKKILKLKIIKIASFSFICIGILGSISPSYAKNSPILTQIAQTIDTIRGYFKVNKSNQTYGTYITSNNNKNITEPDLMLVVGVNNVKGYVKKSDLYNNQIPQSTIQEVEKYMEMKKKQPYRLIPVYKNDGKTIIGEYRID